MSETPVTVPIAPAETTGEARIIAATNVPPTVASLAVELRGLGVATGDVLIVHSSMSSLGWVVGGPHAVVLALREAVGATGTIVMPTQSAQLSDPAGWSNPPVPPAWVSIIRDHVPAYDPALTPTRGMGQVVECFRSVPTARRSSHPTLSFAADGPLADEIVEPHPLSPGLGDGSPLGRLYDLDAQILLLGVGHDSNTSLHLAEHRADWPGRSVGAHGAPVLVGGERRWVAYDDLDLDTDDFETIGRSFAATGKERSAPVGAATARLLPMRDLVDHAVAWMTAHRGR